MSPGPLFRIARRDAWDIMRSRTYIVLFLSPLLLALLIAFVGAMGTAVIVLLKVYQPEAAPLGRDRAAAALAPDAGTATRAMFDDLIVHLKQPISVTPRETKLVRRFAAFLREARQGPGAAESRQGAGAAEGRQGAGAAEGRQGPGAAEGRHGPMTEGAAQLEAKRDLQPLDVVALRDVGWEQLRARVPDQYDAAVYLLDGPDGTPRYRIASDNGLLYSQVMQRQLLERIDDYNRRQREARTPPPSVAITVRDHAAPAPDLWLVRVFALFATFAIAFMYYSVGVQSVAGVLAGERESRTLEVLLSLPITRRQVLYGKLTGLVITTALPTLFWSILLWIPLYRRLGIVLPYAPLVLLLVAFLFAANAAGCAVSAASPNTMVAKNRLGMVNMALFGLGGAVVAMPAWLWPGGHQPIAALVRVVTGGPLAGSSLTFLLAVLVGGAIAVLEAGLAFFKRA